VQVRSADSSSAKFDQYFPGTGRWFWPVFNLQVLSPVNDTSVHEC
jgi:hypothetical protein